MSEIRNNFLSCSSDEEEECACYICFEPEFSGDIKVLIDCCRHEYCNACFELWSEEHNTCPMDRYNFTTAVFMRVSSGEALYTQEFVQSDLEYVETPQDVLDIELDDANLNSNNQQTEFLNRYDQYEGTMRNDRYEDCLLSDCIDSHTRFNNEHYCLNSDQSNNISSNIDADYEAVYDVTSQPCVSHCEEPANNCSEEDNFQEGENIDEPIVENNQPNN